MMWAGCGADQNPIPRREVEHAERYGAEIDAAVSAAIGRSLIPIQGTTKTQFAEIPLEFAGVPDRAQVEANLASSNRYEVGRARVLLEQLERDGQLAKSYPFPIQSWKLGDGPLWLFLGGEVVVDYALRLKGELDAGRTWVASYCNDVMAYIPSLRVLNEGGYEGGDSMVYYGLPSAWDASVEDRVTAEILRQVALLDGAVDDGARSVPTTEYPDHGDLTVWRDATGNLQPIQSPQDWMQRREHLLQSMQSVMGRLPSDREYDAMQVRVLRTESFPGYTRHLISYRTIDDAEVPAHLYVPDSEPAADLRRHPAVLALHPTSPLGKLIVAGEGPKANRNYAVELVGRGYVVLAPDYPSFGDLTNDDFHTDRFISGTMRAIVNHRRAIDVLAARPDVDPQRIGAIGHSLGGHNAIFLGVFDDRVRAVVSSCGWDPFPFYYGGRLGGWASDRYMPRIREVHGNDPKRMPFDFPELIAALAPRSFFSCSPLHDSNFDASGVKEAEAKIREIYRLLGADENLIIAYPDAEHDFPLATRQAAYEFLDRELAATAAPR
jgi:dienelactone hydrolase